MQRGLAAGASGRAGARAAPPAQGSRVSLLLGVASRSRRAGGPRGVAARAADPDNEQDLWQLHEELLREVDERKQSQARLLESLRGGAAAEDAAGSSGSSSGAAAVATPPAAAASAAAAAPAPAASAAKAAAAAAAAPVRNGGKAPGKPSGGGGNGGGGGSLRPPPPPAQQTLAKALAEGTAAAPPSPGAQHTQHTQQQQQKQHAAASAAAADTYAEQLEAQARSFSQSQAAAAAVAAPPAGRPAPVPVPIVAAPAPAPPTPKQQEAPPATQQQEQQRADAPSDEGPKLTPSGNATMNVVFVGAECAPWSKTGGLGDVMGALPKALARRGHRVMAVVPRYDNYDNAWETGVRRVMRVFNQDVEVGFFHAYVDGVDFVFVDHPAFHGRKGGDIYTGSREEILFRCALLCKAGLEAVWHVPCGGVPYGDSNTVFVANDWHTALLPTYLQAHYRDHGQMTYARAVFVIHNMAHQGRGPFAESAALELPEPYREQLRLFDPIGGEHMNVMKAGIQNAHRLIAVSAGYAWECQTPEGGWGLDQVVRDAQWKLRGIVNGIDCDEWSPEKDGALDTDGYSRYTIDTMKQGKAACKKALQRELGLPENPDAPMIGFIGRLDYQKGVDLIRDSAGWIAGQGAQMVLLGSGRDDLENDLRGMEGAHRDSVRGWVGFSVGMAHRITAAADLLLMPSRFEPCGLNQLYAMAYGTVPVVHAVGGLRDTVAPFDPASDTGTGWTFERAEADQMRGALHNALYTYREHRATFDAVARRGMAQDLSWDHAARLYEDVLVEAKFQW